VNSRIPPVPPSPDGTISTMASFTQSNLTQSNRGRGLPTQRSAASIRFTFASAMRADALLLSAILFLQRFLVPFHGTSLHLDLVAIGIILLHQFFYGRLLIQYDRLLWFFLFALAAVASLLLNFEGYMLTAYLQFTIFYAFFTLRRPSNLDRYAETLHTFQFLVMLLSCVAVAQFVAQFVVNGITLSNFYWVFPDNLFAYRIDVRTFGPGIIKSNALFLGEPSSLSQLTALGILIEVMEFGRPKYLLAMTLGFLVAYSGTGAMLLSFLPLAGLRHGKAGLSVLLVIACMLGLAVTGIIDLSAFASRVSEFDTRGTSGYSRFVSPFILAASQFKSVPLLQLLVGSGPGTIKFFAGSWENHWYTGGFAEDWIKILYEYGIIGTLIFICFVVFSFRRSQCPGLVRAALIFAFVFLNGGMNLAIPLCTLTAPKLRGRINAATYGPPRVAASAVG
jgi:hypothetical protein